MKITIELSAADVEELKEFGLDGADEIEQQFRMQLDDGVVGNDGEAGSDWMPDYELVLQIV